VGVRTLANRESTNPFPTSGFSFGPGTSVPSVFIRRRRSEDRFVIVVGTLFSILFVGVSNPHPVLVFFSAVGALTGVIRPLLEVFADIIAFRAVLTPFGVVVATVPSRRDPGPPDPGGPTMTKLAARAAVVARASWADLVRCLSLRDWC
jgi:hypothetical protein